MKEPVISICKDYSPAPLAVIEGNRLAEGGVTFRVRFSPLCCLLLGMMLTFN